MRVRKMNQVDVKLHDLTKVKLKKYRLNWEETGNPVPRIRNYLDGETGLSGSSKKRIGEVTGANHSFFGRK